MLDLFFKSPGGPGFEILRGDLAVKSFGRLHVDSATFSLARATMRQARILSGPDNSGWMHIQINLANLTAFATDYGLPDLWGSLTLRDVSGLGFKLDFANIRIITLEALRASYLGLSSQQQQNGASVASADASGQLGDAASTDSIPIFNVASTDPPAGSNQYILRLRPGTTWDQLLQICAEVDTRKPAFRAICRPTDPATVASVQSVEEPVQWGFQSVTVDSPADLEAMRLLLGSSVEYIERDLKASIYARPMPRDLHEVPASSWGLDRIDQTSLPLNGEFDSGPVNGSGVHVFVLDTGCRLTHEDFVGRVGECRNALSSGVVASVQSGGDAPPANSSDPSLAHPLDPLFTVQDTATVNAYQDVTDRQGHGTHVSGTAVGAIHGVARGAILHAVKVMGDDGSGSYSDIIAGMNWVQSFVKANNITSAVVNLSVGGPRSASLNDATAQLAAAGIFVSVAAGNSHADACSYSPSSASSATGGVASVGATDEQDAMAYYSNFGTCLSIFAPGSDIVSASYLSDTGSRTLSGTSMATPHVSGAAALYLQRYPGASPSQVRGALQNAAVEPQYPIDSRSPDLLLNIEPARLGTNPPPPPPAPPAPAPAPAPVTAPPSPATPPAAPAPAPFLITPVRQGSTRSAALWTPALVGTDRLPSLFPRILWPAWPFLNWDPFSTAATEATGGPQMVTPATADTPLTIPGWS